MKRLMIIDYGSGNLRSVAKAFERVAGKDFAIEVSNDAAAIEHASHIVLPGVGAFADCMAGLAALPGMRQALAMHALQRQRPFLGICVGMQMLLEKGMEHGEHAGLGWIGGCVISLAEEVGGRQADPALRGAPWGAQEARTGGNYNLKIPHMGWNNLHLCSPGHPLLNGIAENDHAYFVHSFHAVCTHGEDVLAEVEYGQRITAVIGRGNLLGTQFHPEKSQATGLTLLRNFLNL